VLVKPVKYVENVCSYDRTSFWRIEENAVFYSTKTTHHFHSQFMVEMTMRKPKIKDACIANVKRSLAYLSDKFT